jgi:quercetin dioxygenase-like cupin family protein
MTEQYLKRGKFRVPVERAAVADDWGARGFSCGLFVDPPGREWRDYVHSMNELLTVTDGELELTVAGESFRVRPGDEVFIPRRALHSVKNVHAGETRWLYGYD